MNALVLDLRNNAGGPLTPAVEVAEQFLDRGKLIVYTAGRTRNQNLRFSAHPTSAPVIVPMVVLVNQASAAASEIVAAALRDWGRATLVGERTMGRSSIQMYFPLADRSALRLTTARWFTPRGKLVAAGSGLAPDVEVTADPDMLPTSEDPARDNQLRRALEVITTKR